MMHFSCDYCGKDMTQNGKQRYVLKMEAFAANDPCELRNEDIETDHVEEMARLLNELEQTEEAPELLPQCQKLKFDLCAGCFGRFVQNPLGRENIAKFDFSSN